MPVYSAVVKLSNVLKATRRKGNQDVMMVVLCAMSTRFARSDPNGSIGYVGAANAVLLESEREDGQKGHQ